MLDNLMTNDEYWSFNESVINENRVCWCGRRKMSDREMCAVCESEESEVL